MVCPISEKINDYAIQVTQAIHNAGFFVDADLTDKTMQKKIREAQLAQYNYILVVGEAEAKKNTVNVRTRDNTIHREKALDQLLDEFRKLNDPSAA